MATIMVAGPFSSLMTEKSGGGFEFDEERKKTFRELIDVLHSNDFSVLSAHEQDRFGEQDWDEDFVSRDLRWVEICDLLIVYLPRREGAGCIRSDGTMIELGYALSLNKPILFLCADMDNENDSFFLRTLIREHSTFDYANKDDEGLLSAIENLLPLNLSPRKHTTDVDETLAELRGESEPHFVKVGGTELKVFPGVLSPRLSHAPDALMSKWRIENSDKILDLGCGCGVLGICALNAGANSLTALDINPQAVENTNFNLRELDLDSLGEARLSNVYEALKPGEKFDVIIFAAPYWDRKADDDLELSCFDEGHQFFKDAVDQARLWLEASGRMYIIFSDQGDVGLASKTIAESGLEIADLHLFRPTSTGGHIRIVWELQLRRR